MGSTRSNEDTAFRYRVVEVTGSMVGRLHVGGVLYDTWIGNEHTYEVLRLPELRVSGSYSVVCEGEATGAELLAMARRAA